MNWSKLQREVFNIRNGSLSTSEDMDGDSYVSVEEFTERCMQLHGPARSADLFALRHQAASRRHRWQLFEIVDSTCFHVTLAHYFALLGRQSDFFCSRSVAAANTEVKMGAQLRRLEVDLRQVKKQMHTIDAGFKV